MSSLSFVPHTVSSVSGHKRKHEKTHKKSSKRIKRSEGSDEEQVYTGNGAVYNDQNEDTRSRSCPYLDTIRRNMLDFDFEKLCSVSLSHLNVYACLICGKYFQGRGNSTHAYTHSVSESHHVFLNLETRRFYCLPDDYEILDGSLEDITYLLNPTFSTPEILALDSYSKMVRAYNGLTYYPGVVGLNNIKANDYCNVILQMLSHISPLRNYFLDIKNFENLPSVSGDQMMLLVQRFSELIRKLWNPRNFKTHVSPHEFLQVSLFLSFSFLIFRYIIPFSIILSVFLLFQTSISDINFFYLTCDLPPPPLYLDEFKENIIPQVSLATLLSKFNGVTEKEYKTHRDSTLRRFELRRLPPYLILYMKRFVKNIFTLEKNPTIVNFPIRSIDFGELLAPEFRAKHR
ncbi:U4/U6.U5 tri-snRNP-associated protein 2 [Schistosoma bovis]|uniref:ubiquitinyl hydrolase 1 n=1 Tax=Schistosoma bovis TaxID=6184 RepID=A0A430QC37_SCHBO|nr:U4/U6.U5 tri-snRNP-associated protein 2 [Schistosoma bovis]